MNIKSLKELLALLRLYKLKEGTLYEISEACGYHPKQGKMYSGFGDRLKEEGIIIPLREEKVNDRWNVVYRIDHHILDQIFLTEYTTKVLYDRAHKHAIKGGPLGLKPRRKKEKKVKKEK